MTYSLFPRTTKFQEHFIALTHSITDISKLFRECAGDFSRIDEYGVKAKEIERRADESTHGIIALLNDSFITPFDREDIHYLAHVLDEIVDVLEDVIQNASLYRVAAPPAPLTKFADLMVKSADTLERLVGGYLNPPRYAPEVVELKKQIYTFERQADDLFTESMRELFARTTDPIALIKYKELLEGAEAVMDTFRDAGTAIENILIKSR